LARAFAGQVTENSDMTVEASVQLRAATLEQGDPAQGDAVANAKILQSLPPTLTAGGSRFI